MAQNEYRVNLNALRGKIIEKYTTVINFAYHFGCTYTHMLDLLSGKSTWTLKNAQKAVAMLELNNEETFRIFFCSNN